MFKNNKELNKKTRTDYIKTILVVACLSFMIIGVAFYFFLIRDFGEMIITMEAEESIMIGNPFNVSIVLDNKTDDKVTDISASLILPSGVVFADGRKDVRRMIRIQEIPSQSVQKIDFTVIVTYPSENKYFNAEIEYMPAILGRTIKTDRELSVLITDWISLEIKTPSQIISGEEFTWELFYKNNSDKNLRANLKLDLPEEMVFRGASESSINIGPNAEGVIKFNSYVVMKEGERFKIRATAIGKINDQEYVLGENEAEIIISSSPLSINIIAPHRDGVALRLGEEFVYTVIIKNNSDIALNNVSVITNLIGEMFADNVLETVEHTPSSMPSLTTIAPGASVEILVPVKISDSYPIYNLDDKNFTSKINVIAESKMASPQNIRIININSLEQRIIGKIRMTAHAMYRDAASRIINEGVFPPIVGSQTEYSIHWNIINYATNMSGVEVLASLPRGVRFLRQVRVDAGELVIDERSGSLSWKIENVQPGTGVISSPISLIFQIQATPEEEHRGTYMTLIEDMVITANDDFTNRVFSSNINRINTELPNDPTVREREGRVR